MNVAKASNARSPFPWFGGKQMLADRILAMFPTHRVYCEARKRGYASPAGVDPIVATPEGLAVAPSEPLPTGRALYEHWLGELPKGARVVLELLYDAWPNGYTAQDLAAAAGYEPGGSSYRAAIAALRNVDLATPSGVDPIRASDELMETS